MFVSFLFFFSSVPSNIMSPREHPPKRQMSDFYEHFVPIALVIILVLMIILGIVSVTVLLGLWPG